MGNPIRPVAGPVPRPGLDQRRLMQDCGPGRAAPIINGPAKFEAKPSEWPCHGNSMNGCVKRSATGGKHNRPSKKCSDCRAKFSLPPCPTNPTQTPIQENFRPYLTAIQDCRALSVSWRLDKTWLADGFEHFQLAGFNDRDGLRAFDRRESFQEIFNRFAAFQGVNQILQGNTRTASGKFPRAGRVRRDVRAARLPVRL